MLSKVRGAWRTWLYLALSYIGEQRLQHVRKIPGGAHALAALTGRLGGGHVRIRGGIAGGLRLDSSYLPPNHTQLYGLVRGSIETDVQEALRRHVFPGAVVYDVGANIGFVTLVAAQLAGPEGRVEAFEPAPNCAAAVRANAALNDFAHVTVHEVAASDRDGEGELLVVGEEAWSHLAERGEHPQTTARLQVPLIDLGAAVARGDLPTPDVIKLDIEGSEVQVLAALTPLLRRLAIPVVCELHETNDEVADLAERLGYRVENLSGTAPIRQAGPVHVLLRRDG